MAIVREHFEINGRQFIRTYSDEHREVVRDGVAYAVAEDPAEIDRQYTEGEFMEYTEDEIRDILNTLTGGES